MANTHRDHSLRGSWWWLAGCGVAMLLVYGAALIRLPLLSSYDVQIFTLDTRVAEDSTLAPMLALATVLLCGLYFGGYLALRRLLEHQPGGGRALTLAVFYVPLAAAVLLLLTHPTSSLDVYDYLFRGHVAVRYGANNFIQRPEDFKGVEWYYWYTSWRRAVTAYGPLWEVLSIAVARLSGTQLLSLVLGFKLLSAVGWLLCGLVIWASVAPERRLLAAYLWLWNPLVLWELVGAAHNDGWMVLFGLLALWVLPRRPTLALLLITAGTLVKYALALLWPVLLVAAWAALPSWRSRLLLAVRAGLLSGVLVVVAYMPWWVGFATLEQLQQRSDLVTNSPLAVARALWGDEKLAIDPVLRNTGLMLLALGTMAACLWVWLRPHRLIPAGAALLLWFSLAASPWVQPWYLIWPLGLLVLEPERRRLGAALAAAAMGSLLVYPAYSALRPWLDWPGDGVRWQLAILALMYLPPLLAVVWRSPRWRLGPLRTGTQVVPPGRPG